MHVFLANRQNLYSTQGKTTLFADPVAQTLAFWLLYVHAWFIASVFGLQCNEITAIA